MSIQAKQAFVELIWAPVVKTNRSFGRGNFLFKPNARPTTFAYDNVRSKHVRQGFGNNL